MTMIGRSGEANGGNSMWQLPPLILHPFADRASSEELLESACTLLVACGLAPASGKLTGDLSRVFLEGRLAEIRMLFFLGKDLVRWMEQCVEFASRIPALSRDGLHEQSFAGLLTDHMPDAVTLKLEGWSVRQAAVMFARAIGLNQLFAQAPESAQLGNSFIRHYHRYADQLFHVWMQTADSPRISADKFRFDLYASGEYTQMLENEWGGDSFET